MMHFMKGVALPFSAAKEWLEVVGKAFRFLGYHRFYPPVLKKSQKWLDWVLNCGLEPMQKAAQTVERHLSGIHNWMRSKINNGILEGLNSIIQAAKRKARGYGKKDFATIAFLLTGKLNLQNVNPFLPTRFG